MDIGMPQILAIGGSRFIGRFTVMEFLDHGYDVTLFSRGKTDVPFSDREISHVVGDRQNPDDLVQVRDSIDPDIVVDFIAYHPKEVRESVNTFQEARYIYISSTHAYERTANIPLREGVTPLQEYSTAKEDDYGACKAEGDRIIFQQARRGQNVLSIRPTAVYGPYDYTERLDYWINRVNNYATIMVPGDEFRMPIHLVYVGDVAKAVRLIAERGNPGDAFNVASRNHVTFRQLIQSIADSLGTSVEIVHATDSYLERFGMTTADFSLCEPYPYLVSTEKLASLGWESTDLAEGIEPTIDEHLQSSRVGSSRGPSRDKEERIIDSL